MSTKAFALLLLLCVALSPAATYGGEFEKGGVNGNITVTVLPKSTDSVKLYEWVVGIGVPVGWREVRTIGPGSSADFDGVDGKIKLTAPGEYRASSDVSGGFDVHFDNVWVQVRHR